MSRAETLLSELLTLCPAFQDTWENERTFGRGEDGRHTVCGIFAILSHFVADQLHASDPAQLDTLFQYVESQMVDDDVSNDIAYCFFENLMNRMPDIIDPQIFTPLLGPLSTECCRDLDAAWGTNTLGLQE